MPGTKMHIEQHTPAAETLFRRRGGSGRSPSGVGGGRPACRRRLPGTSTLIPSILPET